MKLIDHLTHCSPATFGQIKGIYLTGSCWTLVGILPLFFGQPLNVFGILLGPFFLVIALAEHRRFRAGGMRMTWLHGLAMAILWGGVIWQYGILP